nr:hypothetical protein [Tanacetum cinerariifolium]
MPSRIRGTGTWTPQQNGVAERRNKTLIEATRTILADAKLPVTFWAEAVNTACYVQNRVLGSLKQKGMNDTLLGTNSTNFSGTKEAAGQDVKKDVSSLRYIALPNYGNSNPTATSLNPPADHMETLAVETPIPTISSPVSTACLNDSSKLLSDTRLISKRVTSQNDTPSLKNILTLTNSSTRTKSKEMEEQSFIATIHQKTNPALLQFCLFSCFLSQEEPKKIFDALKDPSWVEAIPIGTKGVLKNKKDERGIVIRNKARLVAQGHTQEEGSDYDEVFTPVARIEAIRLFLAYASFMGFTVYQMDVKSAFLYGTIDEEVYLYREFEALMHEKFQMSAMGELNFFLGLQVLQKKDDIFLSQDKYVGDILKKFRYSDVRSANNLMDKENPWGKDGTGKDGDLHLYRSMIGSLMYLTASRPDIMFAVCACARHQMTPKEYSDYGGATQDRKPTTGGCQFLGRRLISWKCKKQKIVATSTTEAEYVAAASGYIILSEIVLKKLISVDHIHTDDNVADLLTKPFDVRRFQYLVVEHAMRGSVLGNYIIYTAIFWSTARIETTDERTKILATVDDKPRTISESSIRRNLKLRDEAGISSLPDAEFFENLTLMRYNILPNQKFSFQKGIPTEPHHTPFPEAQPTSPTATSSPSLPHVTTVTIPTVIPTDTPQLMQYTRRARIAYDLTPRVTSLAANEGSMQQKLNELTDLCTRLQRQQDEMALKITSHDLEIVALKARIKHLEDRDGGDDDPSGKDATIKERRLETGEEVGIERSTKKGSDDTKEIVNVLTSLVAASVLSSGVQMSVSPAAEVATVSIPLVGEIHPISVPTGSGVVPTASPIFPTGSSEVPTASPIYTTATVATPYSRRKDGLDRNNETVAKYLQEYHQFAAELPIGKRIELISDLVKYQYNYAKVLKYHIQQRKPLSRKQRQEFYMSIHKSHAGWKARHFKGMTLEEIKEKFDPVWKQFQDFIPIGSKEEAKRFKRKGLRLEQDSAKKVKTSEEVSEEDLKDMMQLVPVEEVYVEALQVKHLIIDWEVHTEGERSYWKIIRLGGSTTSYQFFVDMLKHFDREDLNQLWALVKETLNIKPAISDKEKELWVELKRLYEPDVEDQLWTQTQALMHDPVEWRLYDRCGVHHILSRD